MADSFPVFRDAKIAYLLLCGFTPVRTERDTRDGRLIVHFPAEASSEARTYESLRLAIKALASRGGTPTPDELVEACDAVGGGADE